MTVSDDALLAKWKKTKHIAEKKQQTVERKSSADAESTRWHSLSKKNRFDPRPDLKQDANLWRAVLRTAHKLDRKVYGVLHGIRCLGGRLVTSESHLELKPRYGNGNLASIQDAEEWKKLCTN